MREPTELNALRKWVGPNLPSKTSSRKAPRASNTYVRHNTEWRGSNTILRKIHWPNSPLKGNSNRNELPRLYKGTYPVQNQYGNLT